MVGTESDKALSFSSLHFDEEVCLEILSELIAEQGTTVFRLRWDSGGPGAGAGEECVDVFRGLYWPCSSNEGYYGPFETLEEAINQDCGCVTGATRYIECAELTAAQLIPLLHVAGAPEHPFKINGELWMVVEPGEIVSVR